jgi:hypothetical protein
MHRVVRPRDMIWDLSSRDRAGLLIAVLLVGGGGIAWIAFFAAPDGWRGYALPVAFVLLMLRALQLDRYRIDRRNGMALENVRALLQRGDATGASQVLVGLFEQSSLLPLPERARLWPLSATDPTKAKRLKAALRADLRALRFLRRKVLRSIPPAERRAATESIVQHEQHVRAELVRLRLLAARPT